MKTICIRFAHPLAFAITILLARPCLAQWDVYPDTWCATDQEMRTLPTRTTGAPVPQANRTVGILYYAWAGQHGTDLYDISKILAGQAEWGPQYAFHQFYEPELGYYKWPDDYVFRKHVEMLADAGVDVMVFDASNGSAYYDSVVANMLNIMDDMRLRLGVNVPKVCFLTSFDLDNIRYNSVNELWSKLYKPGNHQGLWFQWQGKPLLLAKPDNLNAATADPAVEGFFTFRPTWAATLDDSIDKWLFMDNSPQGLANGEQKAVAVATWAVADTTWPNSNYYKNAGRSYHNGAQPPEGQQGNPSFTHNGILFNEMWANVLAAPPAFVFVTGWNEWQAQRFIYPNGQDYWDLLAGNPLTDGQSFFVDGYNLEYSRDIEPMKGGYNDSYYYQLVANIRRYKGVNPRPVPVPQPITVDGSFADWTNVGPEYRDRVGDIDSRNSYGYGNLLYQNFTGRNDLQLMKVSYDATNLYFYAKVAATHITDWVGASKWMTLFIDTDSDYTTGWHGFEYRINGEVTVHDQTPLKKWTGTAWTLKQNLSYYGAYNEIEITVPRAAINLTGKDPCIRFKWMDNYKDGDDYWMEGDQGPSRGFSYLYSTFDLAPQWEWAQHDQFEGWTFNSGGTGAGVGSNEMWFDVNGTDPQMFSPNNLALDARNKIIHIGMAVSGGGTRKGRISFQRSTDSAWYSGRSVVFNLRSDGAYTDYTVNMANNPYWTGTIKCLRFDPVDSGAASNHVDLGAFRVLPFRNTAP